MPTPGLICTFSTFLLVNSCPAKHNWLGRQNERSGRLPTLEELGLNSLEGWDDGISDWFFIGLTEIPCIHCEVFGLIISPERESAFPSDFRFLCASCLEQKRFVDFSMSQQSYLTDKYKFILQDGLEKHADDALKTQNLLKVLLGDQSGKRKENSRANQNKQFAVMERKVKGNEDAPIPSGYRSISWIRFYEAEAIIHAYKSKSDFELKSDSSALVFKCLYFENDSEERRKFKANVQAIRVNNQNQRVIGWIRLEEARAVVEAHKLRKDIDFAHLKFGNGGKVQFFSEDLEVAKKYRSSTRLLRAD